MTAARRPLPHPNHHASPHMTARQQPHPGQVSATGGGRPPFAPRHHLAGPAVRGRA